MFKEKVTKAGNPACPVCNSTNIVAYTYGKPVRHIYTPDGHKYVYSERETIPNLKNRGCKNCKYEWNIFETTIEHKPVAQICYLKR